MRFRATFLILIFSIFLTTYGQNTAVIDSLRKIIALNEENTNLVDALNSLAWQLQHNKPTEAKEYLNRSIEISNRINYEFGKAKATSHLGSLAANQGNFNEAFRYFSQAKSIFETLNNADEIAKCLSKLGGAYYSSGDYEQALVNYKESLAHFSNKIGIANSYNNIALAYQATAEYSLAIEYFVKAAELFNELQQPTLVATTYNNIGLMYSHQKEYTKAEEYYNDALTKAEKLNSPLLLAQTKTNIGTIYEQRKEYNKAIEVYKEANVIFIKLGKQTETAVTYNNIANTYKHLNQKKLAIVKYKEAQKIFHNTGNKYQEAATLNNIGLLMQDKGYLKDALPYFLDAYKLCEVSGEIHTLTAISENIASIYKSLENHEQSLKFHTIYSDLNDSLNQAQKDELKKETEAKYQNKEKSKVISEQQTKIEQKSNFLAWSLVGIGILSFIASILYTFFRNSKKRATRLSDEKSFIELEKNELESILSEKEEVLSKLQERAVYKQETLPPHFSKLSKREVEVLILLGEGLSDNEIADKLFVSITTVRTHLRRIYSKLLIKSRVEAVNIVHKFDISSLEA